MLPINFYIRSCIHLQQTMFQVNFQLASFCFLNHSHKSAPWCQVYSTLHAISSRCKWHLIKSINIKCSFNDLQWAFWQTDYCSAQLFTSKLKMLVSQGKGVVTVVNNLYSMLLALMPGNIMGGYFFFKPSYIVCRNQINVFLLVFIPICLLEQGNCRKAICKCCGGLKYSRSSQNERITKLDRESRIMYWDWNHAFEHSLWCQGKELASKVTLLKFLAVTVCCLHRDQGCIYYLYPIMTIPNKSKTYLLLVFSVIMHTTNMHYHVTNVTPGHI